MKIDFIGLELIVFHDLPLNNMIIEGDPASTLSVDVSEFDEETEGYIEKKLIFGEIEKMHPQAITVEDFSDAEIYSFDYYLKDGLLHGTMMCLFGIGKPSFEIEFSCKSVEILQ